jgi:spore maturation protein A
MVNIIWGLFIIIGIVYGFITGSISSINTELLECGKKAFDLILDLMPLLVIWMGLMQIAEKSGLIKKLSKIMSPLLSKLFPSIPKNHEAIGYIASNVAINMAGLGSAATPFGLKAMEKLEELNPNKKVASDAMITFLVLNTAGVTIIPTTIIALRMSAGSNNPTKVLPLCILATFSSLVAGLSLDYIIRKIHGKH